MKRSTRLDAGRALRCGNVAVNFAGDQGARDALGAFMLLAFAFVAQTKPDFSGVWQLNLEKSTFRGPAPKEVLTKIQHREPILTQTMLLVAADGGEQQLAFTYDTAGTKSTNVTTGGGEGQSRAHWNGSELVIDSVLRTPSRTYHFSDHWSLSPDGQTLTMAHRDDDLAGQIAISERASPDVAARFKRQ